VQQSSRPLDGFRVLELGQLMAGPFAGTLLGYFGAEVIKVEPPATGDPVRGWRGLDDGTSLWWYSLARNKKCITLDLRHPAGQSLARRLAAKVDVLIENFRPGTMERWGLGPEDLKPDNPGLVYCRVSGFGQTGPYAARPGFASVCEAVGGLRYVTGTPGEPPVRANLSLGDTLAGLHAGLGIVLALLHRERRRPGAAGQVVDVAIYEAVYNLMEAAVPEHDRLGLVREPSGTTVTGIVPTNLYPCADGRGVVIGANSEPVYRRLMSAVGRLDLADDPELQSNAGRVPRQAELDAAIAAWTRTLPAAEVIDRLAAAAVPAGPVNSVADMLEDPHFQSRGLFEEVEAAGRPLKIPALAPKLSATPGRTDWPGPALGAHNREILGGLLGLTEAELETLADLGAV
jgi:crotonobetainyl-CoA:carnitine CoA-transferase CaiB-like acyl-CoA transferase